MKKIKADEIFSIPNIMSYVRILLIPVFCVLYSRAETLKEFVVAGVIVFLCIVTDFLDGYVARKFHMVTTLGKILDPVADKLMHAALALCVAFRHPLMWVLIVLMAVKEGYMAIMGIKYLHKGRMLDGAMWYGKICTAVLFAGLLILFVFPEIPAPAANTLIVVMMCVMAVTFIKYIMLYHKIKENADIEEVKKVC